MTAINSLYSSRLQLIQQQQILRSGNVNEQNVSLFENTEGLTQGMVDGTCVDGKDDGKIGFWEGLKSIGKGILNFGKKLLNPVNLIKGVAIGVGIAALNICLPGVGTAITGALIVGGAVKGGVQIGKGVYEASQATTDAEKREALENVGEGAATLGTSLLAAKGFKNATNKSVFSKETYTEAYTNNIGRITSGVKAAKTAAKEGFGNLTKAAKPSAIKANVQSKFSALKENINFTEDQQAFLDLLKENPTSTMKEFGTEFMPQVAKSVASGVKTTTMNSLAQAKQFIQSSASNMSIDSMVAKLGEMGIDKAQALTLIKQATIAEDINSAASTREFYM